MEKELFTLSDFGQDANGKLNIIGTFDQVMVQELPATLPNCTLTARVRFEKREAGKHQLKIKCVDALGKEIFQTIEGNLEVNIPIDQNSLGVNLVINLNQIKVERAGEYYFELYISNNRVGKLPIKVLRTVMA